MVWHDENPKLLEKIREVFQQVLPGFFLHIENDKVFVRGLLSMWNDAKLFGRYLVEFEFPENYPQRPTHSQRNRKQDKPCAGEAYGAGRQGVSLLSRCAVATLFRKNKFY
ncbi:MAG: hypothetical protein COV79_01740 [Parcubacteria group bacterium CG11_big_fil_rev_8_21_14_0_20_41_14]|nr:MAG: hypothetical protein COV79_01740 [Parcubacteria group bacterium CG11_big_fil_rev_8_21_14_0_20_41_14]